MSPLLPLLPVLYCGVNAGQSIPGTLLGANGMDSASGWAIAIR